MSRDDARTSLTRSPSTSLAVRSSDSMPLRTLYPCLNGPPEIAHLTAQIDDLRKRVAEYAARFKPRGATMTLPQLPPKTEYHLDGHTLVITDPDRPIPIATGQHIISLAGPKRESREYEFYVHDGDNVVVVGIPFTRDNTNGRDKADTKSDKTEKNDREKTDAKKP